MKKFGLLLQAAMLASLLLLTACSKEGTDPEPSPGPDEHGNAVLNENTVELSAQQAAHLLSIEEHVLTFDASIAAGGLPQEGQILLVAQPDESFPRGFLGCVTRVEKRDGQYRVETKPAALADAFDVLYVDTSFEPGDSATRNALLGFDEEGYFHINPSLNVATKHVSLNGSSDLAGRLRLKIAIDKQRNLHEAHMAFDLKYSADIGSSFHAEVQSSDENLPPVPIGPPIPLAMCLKPIAIAPQIQFAIQPKVSGEAALELGMHYRTHARVTLDFDGKRWSGKFEEIADDNVQNDPFTGDVTLRGSFFIGLVAGVELYILDQTVALEPRLGPVLSGDVEFALGQSNLYQTLEETRLEAGIKAGLDASAKMKIFKWDTEWTMPLFETDVVKTEVSLFPKFFNEQVGFANGTCDVAASLSRNLLFPSDVGLAMYRNGERTSLSEPQSYWCEPKNELSIRHEFTGIPSSENYEAWSYVKWGGLFIKAKKLGEQLSIVGHWKAVSYLGGETDDHIYIFNEDGTGVFTDADGYPNNITNDEKIEYTYDAQTGILKYFYIDIHEGPYTLRITDLTQDRFKLYDGDEWWIFKRIK